MGTARSPAAAAEAEARPSRIEAWLWLAVGVYTFVILASAYFVQFALDFLRHRAALTETVAATFVGAGLAVLALVVWRRPGLGEIVVLVVGARVYLFVLGALHIVQERIHLLQYGLLGALSYAAFAVRWGDEPGRGWRPVAAAVMLTAAVGWADEGVQYRLPNRVYDTRDVALNALSGGLAVGLLVARQRVREAVLVPPA